MSFNKLKFWTAIISFLAALITFVLSLKSIRKEISTLKNDIKNISNVINNNTPINVTIYGGVENPEKISQRIQEVIKETKKDIQSVTFPNQNLTNNFELIKPNIGSKNKVSWQQEEMQSWVNSPQRIIQDNDLVYEIPVSGRIRGENFHNLMVIVKIKTDKWYNQFSSTVDENGIFSGIVFIHKTLPPMIVNITVEQNNNEIETHQIEITD